MANSLTGKKLFGAGRFFGINGFTNPTPTRFQTMQDSSIDFKAATKSLFGENRLPVAVAVGEVTITGKVTMGANNSRMFADLLFADAQVVGQIRETDKEAVTVPATPYQVTVANAAHYAGDLGVTDLTGNVWVRVASSPTTGQYSVNTSTGVYTFAAADTTDNLLISYLNTATSTTGSTITVANTPMGPAGSFTGVMVMPYGGEQDVFSFNNCITQGAGIALKNGDYAKPTFDFMCSTDSTDTLGTLSFAEQT